MADGTSQSLKSRVSAEEWQARVDLAALYRLVALHGWDDMIFTHISARVPGPDRHFLINPFGYMFEEITASSLVKIDAEGGKVMGDGPVNYAGFVIHGAIHDAREDAHAVIHLHTPYGQAVSAMAEGLMAFTQTAMIAERGVAYHDYEGVAVHLDERKRLTANLGDKNLMILRNHGTLCTGATIGQAFVNMYYLERACEVQVLMLSAGREGLRQPSPESLARTRNEIGNTGMKQTANELAWPALLRKLDRMDSSFRS